MPKNLHIKPYKLTKNQSFEDITGVLTLQTAGEFNVSIPEYLEELKQIDLKIKKNISEQNNSYAKLQRLYALKSKDGWSPQEKISNDANNQEYKNNIKKLEEDIVKLRSDKTNLNQKYKDTNWAWQLVGNGIKDIPNHNSSFLYGLDNFKIDPNGVKEYLTITFSKLIEGGGLAWIEAFSPTIPATGKLPRGFFVRAIGTPKIIRSEWTDFDFNPIKTKVKFGSEVLLHIYTNAMYGQENIIKLIDRDIFDPNDELAIGTEKTFVREALVYKIHANEDKKLGVDGQLLILNQATKKSNSEQYLQKMVVEVLITPQWKAKAGTSLKIYPTVQSVEKETYYKDFPRSYLEVGEDGVLYETPKEITNLPVLVGEVETNVAAFHPCQYTVLDYINDKGETTNLFTEKSGTATNPNLEIGIITGSEPKKFKLKVDDKSNTIECNFHGKAKGHEKNIFTYENKLLPKNISIINHLPKAIEGNAFFDYKNVNLFSYLFLSESKLKNLPKILIKGETCRHQNKINILTVPDIKWEGYVLITSKTPESYSHTNMPSNKDSFGDSIVSDENGKPTRKNIFQIHQKKARETGVKSKNINQDFTGEVHLKATYNEKKESSDYGAYIEDKIKLILDKLSLAKKTLDLISHRDEAVSGKSQGAMKTIKPFVGNSKSKVALPVFIEFTFPTIRLGGGWYWKYIEDDKKIKCVGELQFGAEPLIQGKGGIDLVAAAEYIPVVKPVLTALNYVKKGAKWMSNNTPVKIDAELYFNLYVKGKIDFRQTIDFYNSSNYKTEIKASLLLGIELGFKIKATIEKVIFTKNEEAGGQEIAKTGFDGQLSAEAESGFVVKASGGKDDNGAFVQASIDFTGITLKIVGKLAIYRPGKKVSNLGLNDKFDLVDYKENIIEPIRHDFI